MFRKISGYFKYRRIIKENFEVITQRYKFRYDRIYGRLYTVLNVTEDKQEVLKMYGYEYLDNEVKKYIASIEEYFFSIGMIDLISVSRIDSLDAINVLIVLRYKYNIHQAILYILFAIISLIILSAIGTGVVKLIMLLVQFIWGLF